MFTFMQALPPRLARLSYFYKNLFHLCYTLVLSLLLFGVGFGLNLTSFWGCLRLISHAFICFIRSFKSFRMRSCMFFIYPFCCNFNLGLATEARACKVAGQKRKPGSERKCEGMNLHTPKGASTLGVGVSVNFRMFIERLQRPKFNGLKSFLYYWKDIET